MAEQSKQIAQASRRLIEGDAQARRDLLAAQKQLSSELHSERASIDRQREEMEQERRNIAAQRHRDPMIAQAINAVGLTLACLLPLALAAYVIRAVNQDGDDSAALSELLVMEITAERPLLLPVSPRPAAALEHAHAPRVTSGHFPDDSAPMNNLGEQVTQASPAPSPDGNETTRIDASGTD